jgi:hypothetical protein
LFEAPELPFSQFSLYHNYTQLIMTKNLDLRYPTFYKKQFSVTNLKFWKQSTSGRDLSQSKNNHLTIGFKNPNQRTKSKNSLNRSGYHRS